MLLILLSNPQLVIIKKCALMNNESNPLKQGCNFREGCVTVSVCVSFIEERQDEDKRMCYTED